MQTQLTPEQELLRKAKEEVERRHGKSTEELFKEREKRVRDAIELRESDRVRAMVRAGNELTWN